MKKPIILLTGGQAYDSQFHSRSTMLNHTYLAAVVAAGGTPLLMTDPTLAEEYAAMADGLICTGTQECAPEPGLLCEADHEWRNEREQRMIHAFMKAGKPILGICLGMQQINAALGGELERHFRFTVGVEHNRVTHPVYTAEGSLLRRLFGAEFPVNSYHNVRVNRLAEGLRVTATSPEGVIEAYEHETHPIWAFQFHPERARGEFRDPPEGPDMTPVFDYFVTRCAEENG